MPGKNFHSADATTLLNTSTYSGHLTHDGNNPLTLFEKAVRDRVTESLYWKEQCFGLNAASLCDRAAELTCIGGTFGDTGQPTHFLCLAFKLITLGVEKDIIREYLNWVDIDQPKDPEANALEENGNGVSTPPPPGAYNPLEPGYFKYLRALAAFYVRLMWSPVEIYQALSPLLSDSRKLRRRTKAGYTLTFVDQFIDDLLTKDRVCGTSLWKLPPREQLEDLELLEPHVSPLQDEVDREDDSEDERDDGSIQSERQNGNRSP